MPRFSQIILLISLPFASRAADSKPEETKRPNLPSDSASHGIGVPPNQKLLNVALGLGSQNYTSLQNDYTNFSIAWVYQGAVAELRSIAQFTSPVNPDVTKVSEDWIGGGQGGLNSQLPLLGKHFFQYYKVPGHPDVALPVFDFSVSLNARGENSYLEAEKTGAMDSPVEPKENLPWLQLQTVGGTLAKTVLRTDTKRGWGPVQPGQVGQKVQMRYSAIYWFYG